jgi:hypothetical protein
VKYHKCPACHGKYRVDKKAHVPITKDLINNLEALMIMTKKYKWQTQVYAIRKLARVILKELK